ncbi:hypothetical protein [Mycobacteroides abscessus]|uniref:hypothetical protein n=1 Tax=Mycobacteroides abscessus TaxID=36809 RepID=UPI0013F5C2D5|nr:hypothetical protein [Mycobacteroides abscessus]
MWPAFDQVPEVVLVAVAMNCAVVIPDPPALLALSMYPQFGTVPPADGLVGAWIAWGL